MAARAGETHEGMYNSCYLLQW